MSKGIRISSKNFSDVSEALEKSGIDWTVWNAEALMDPNYNGPIDIECQESCHFEKFLLIVRNAEKRSS